jgi:hypothetical protein
VGFASLSFKVVTAKIYKTVLVSAMMEGLTSGSSSSNSGRSNAKSKLIPIESHPGHKAPGSLLDERTTTDPDELYSENERALSEFMRLHPMLSLEATSEKTLSCISKLMKDTDLKPPEPEIVSKAHDDMFLCRPSIEGERECILGEKCICRWMSIFRYGEETERAFTAKEFLLPSQLRIFQESGKLPQIQQKCLICTRYFASYIYHLARTCPTFKVNSPMSLNLFANQVYQSHGMQTEMMPISNESGSIDEYRSDVMLYVDEEFANTTAARDGISQLLFQPIVRFKCNDYDFIQDSVTGEWKLGQNRLGTAHFGRPVS